MVVLKLVLKIGTACLNHQLNVTKWEARTLSLDFSHVISYILYLITAILVHLSSPLQLKRTEVQSEGNI